MPRKDMIKARETLWRKAGKQDSSPRHETAKTPAAANPPRADRDMRSQLVKLAMHNSELAEACAKLETDARQLADLYDYAPMEYFSLSATGHVRQLNFKAADMLGSEAHLVVGRDFTEFISPDHRHSFKRFLSRIFAGENAASCEVSLVMENQPSLIARLTGTLSPNGMVCRIAAFDVSTERRMEAAMREKNLDLECIFNLSPDLLGIAGSDGRFHRVNPGFTRVLGHQKEDLTRKGFLTLVHPDDAESTLAAMSRLAEGDEVLDFVNRYRCADGSYRWLEWRACPYGKGMICAMARDITGRKQAEHALREGEARLGLFIQHAPAAIAMFDREMRYLAASDRWKRDYGLRGELRGVSHYEVFPEIPNPWKDVHRRGLAGETLSAEEDVFQRSDGSEQWLKWEVRPWFSSDGEVGGILIGTEDITERRKAREHLENEVQRRTAQLRARTRQLSALAGELTHAEERERRKIAGVIHEDLQQMLVAAVLNLDMLKSNLGNQAADADFARIERMLRDSIKTARSLSAELSPPVLQQCGLAAAIKWLGEQNFEKYGLKVAVAAEDGADPEPEAGITLFRSVSELLLNIIKHAGVKSAALRICRTDGNRLEVELSDAGVGFDPQEVRAREGSAGGFGLFSIRERLEWLGGGLDIQSAPGCGSRFTLWVPLGTASKHHGQA